MPNPKRNGEFVHGDNCSNDAINMLPVQLNRKVDIIPSSYLGYIHIHCRANLAACLEFVDKTIKPEVAMVHDTISKPEICYV